MPPINVPSRSHFWPHVAVLALVGIAAAGCSDSSRFDSNPYASNRNARQQETTGSIASRPASSGHVESQPQPLPLPAPSRPAPGARGRGPSPPGTSDVTGSVPARPAPAPTGHWTWDGGSPVTVSSGETI